MMKRLQGRAPLSSRENDECIHNLIKFADIKDPEHVNDPFFRTQWWLIQN